MKNKLLIWIILVLIFSVTALATAEMVLTLNGIDDDIVINNGESVLIEGNLIIPSFGDLLVYVDDVFVAGVPSGSIIVVDDYPFVYQVDPYVVKFEFTDVNGNYEDFSVTHSVTVVGAGSGDDEVPVFSNEECSGDGVYVPDMIYGWRVEVSDNVGVNVESVKLVFDSQDYPAINLGNGIYEVFISDVDAGSHSYFWYAEDTSGNSAQSIPGNLVIDKADPNMVLTLNGLDDDLVVFDVENLVDIVGTLNVPSFGDLRIYVEDVLFAEVAYDSIIVVDFPFVYQVDPYEVKFEFTDLTGNYNDFDVTHTVTVVESAGDDEVPMFSNEECSGDGVYVPDMFYAWRVEVSDNVGVNVESVKLVFDSQDYFATNIGNGIFEVFISDVDAGSHSYFWYAEDTSGNSAQSIPGNLVIDKADPNMVLTLNGLDDDLVVFDVENLVDIVGTLNVPSFGDLIVYVDDVLIAEVLNDSIISVEAYPFVYQVDPYEVKFEFTDLTGNYNNFDVSHSVTVVDESTEDTEAPTFSNFFSLGDGVYVPGMIYPWRVEVSDNVGVNVESVKLVFDSQDYFAINVGDGLFDVFISDVDAGSHSYFWYAEDTSGNSAQSIPGNLVIDKADPNMVLTLNGLDDDLVVFDVENLVDIVGTLNVPSFGDLRIYVEDVLIAEVLNDSIISVEAYPFVYQVDPYVVKFEFTDVNGNYEDFSVTHSVTVVDESTEDTEAPTFSNFFSLGDGVYVPGMIYPWRVEVSDNVGVNVESVKLVFDSQDYFAINVGDGLFDVFISDVDAGSHSYFWYAEDVFGNSAQSVQGNLVIDNADPNMVLTLNGIDDDIVINDGEIVLIEGNLIIPSVGDLRIYIEDVLFAEVPYDSTIIITDFLFNYQIDPYEVRFEFFDVTGNYNDFDVTHTVTVVGNGGEDNEAPQFSNEEYPDDAVYGHLSGYNWKIEITDDVEVNNSSVQFFLNGLSQIVNNTGNGFFEVVIPSLNAGNYDYWWYAEDTSGKPAQSTPGNLVISKAVPEMNFTVRGKDDNITVNNEEIILIEGTLISPALGDLNLYVNGNLIGTPVINGSVISENYQFNSANIPEEFIVTFEFAGANPDNYETKDLTHTVTVVEDTEDPQFSNEVDPVDDVYVPNFNYTWQVDVADDIAVNDASVKLVFDLQDYSAINLGNGTFEVVIPDIEVGTYNYNWYAEDTSGNEATTTPGTLIISKADPKLHLFIDQYEGDVSVNIGSLIELDGTATPNILDLELYLETNNIENGTGIIHKDYLFDTAGIFEVRLYTPGNHNYNEKNVSYNVTVADLPEKSNYKVNGNNYTDNYNLDYTYFDLTFETDVPTTCRWSLSAQDYDDMSNTFNGAGTINHDGTVTVIEELTSQTVYVACEGELANANDEKTFNVQNVLDGSTIDPTSGSVSTVTDSIVTDSTVDNNSTIFEKSTIRVSTIDNSTVKTCALTNCNVVNSYAEGVVASNCKIIDSPNSAINVTGDNWEILDNSTVHNSELNDTIVKDNSIVNSSVISNSTIENVELTGAVVDNNIVTEGTVKYDSDGDGIREAEIIITPPDTLDLTQIINYAPVADINAPAAGDINVVVNFVSDSTDLNIGGALNDSLTYEWNFGDSSPVDTTENPSHTYTTEDTFTVTLTVTDNYGKSDTTQHIITITTPSTTSSNNNSHRSGSSGGSSRINTVYVWKDGTEKSFRMLDLLRFSVNNIRYPTTVNVYRTDSGKVTLLIRGLRYEILEDETKEFDLNNDGIKDVSITGVNLQKSSAVLRFFPAGTINTGPQYIVPPMPIFNIPPVQEVQDNSGLEATVKEEVEETAEIELNAKVGGSWDRLINSIKNLFSSNKEGKAVSGSSWIAMGIIAGFILIGLGVYFVIKKLYFA